MKAICISCFDYYDNRTKQITEFFNEIGYETEYIITDFNHFSKNQYISTHNNVKQIHVIPYKNNISFQRIMSHYFFSKDVLKEIEKNEPDIIYCMIPPNSLARDLGKYKNRHHNCKLVFDVYDMWPESMPLKKFRYIGKIPFKFWANIRDKWLPNANLITTVSEDCKQNIISILKEKYVPVKVIYPVIQDIRRPVYNFKGCEGLSLCYLGNINYITDLKLMLDLLVKIRKHTTVQIHFIGEGLNHDKIADELKKHEIEVINHGVLFDIADKNKIFALCDMGINLPKQEVRSSMSLKSVEYLRAGLPIINSGVGDNWEMIKKHKIGINVSNDIIDSVAMSIANLSAKDIENMHNNCISIYDKRFVKQDYNAIFQALL